MQCFLFVAAAGLAHHVPSTVLFRLRSGHLHAARRLQPVCGRVQEKPVQHLDHETLWQSPGQGHLSDQQTLPNQKVVSGQQNILVSGETNCSVCLLTGGFVAPSVCWPRAGWPSLAFAGVHHLLCGIKARFCGYSSFINRRLSREARCRGKWCINQHKVTGAGSLAGHSVPKVGVTPIRSWYFGGGTAPAFDLGLESPTLTVSAFCCLREASSG